MASEPTTGCCSDASDAPTGLPIVIQIGDLEPHTEGEPIEQFQARLAAVLLSVVLGILTPEGQ